MFITLVIPVHQDINDLTIFTSVLGFIGLRLRLLVFDVGKIIFELLDLVRFGIMVPNVFLQQFLRFIPQHISKHLIHKNHVSFQIHLFNSIGNGLHQMTVFPFALFHFFRRHPAFGYILSKFNQSDYFMGIIEYRIAP